MLDSLRSNDRGARWLLILLLFFTLIFINWPFFIPLILAAIFALGLHDFIVGLSSRVRLNYKLTVLLSLFGGLALFWIPLSLAIYRAIGHFSQPQTFETDRILTQVSSLKESTITQLQKLSEWMGTDLATPMKSILEKLLQKTGEVILSSSSQILSELPSIILSSFVFTIVLLLLLIKAREIKSFILRYSPLQERTTESLVAIFKKSCSVTLFSTLAVGLVQAALVGLGSLIFSEGDFWLVLAVTFLVSFIPVVGAAPVGYLLALLAFLGDRMVPAMGMALVATVAGSIDNFLKPLIISGSTKVSPVLSFTCVIGAVIMLGLPGLLLGPIILSLFIGVLPLLSDFT